MTKEEFVTEVRKTLAQRDTAARVTAQADAREAELDAQMVSQGIDPEAVVTEAYAAGPLAA